MDDRAAQFRRKRSVTRYDKRSVFDDGLYSGRINSRQCNENQHLAFSL
jgi:hypothetical protein